MPKYRPTKTDYVFAAAGYFTYIVARKAYQFHIDKINKAHKAELMTVKNSWHSLGFYGGIQHAREELQFCIDKDAYERYYLRPFKVYED